jgi:hypothetical protein
VTNNFRRADAKRLDRIGRIRTQKPQSVWIISGRSDAERMGELTRVKRERGAKARDWILKTYGLPEAVKVA